MKTKLIVFVMVVLLGEAGSVIMSQTADPSIRTSMSLAAVNGGWVEGVSLRGYDSFRSMTWLFRVLAYAAFGVGLFMSEAVRVAKKFFHL